MEVIKRTWFSLEKFERIMAVVVAVALLASLTIILGTIILTPAPY